MAGDAADANIFAHPSVFRTSGTTWQTVAGSNEIIFDFDGTSLAVEIDDTLLRVAGSTAINDRFSLSSVIDGISTNAGTTTASGGATDLGGNQYRCTLATGLAAGRHNFRGMVKRPGSNTYSLKDADPPTGSLIIKKFVKSDGSALTTYATPALLRPKTMVTYGDSRAALGISSYDMGNPIGVLAAALQCNDVRIVNTGMGLKNSTISITPTLEDCWDEYWPGVARPVASDVDYVWAPFSMGPNDAVALVTGPNWQAALSTIIAGCLTLYPNATILVAPDLGNNYRAEALAAVTAAGSSRVKIVDLYSETTEYKDHYDGSPATASFYSTDRTHLATLAMPIVGGAIAGATFRALGFGQSSGSRRGGGRGRFGF